jgi:hypothetical protein
MPSLFRRLTRYPLGVGLDPRENRLERYRARAARPAELLLRRLRNEFRELIATRGIAVERLPSWFRGGAGATVFYITLDGMFLLPVQQVRVKDGAAPWPPYVATTFLSRDIADTDLAELTGEDLGERRSRRCVPVRGFSLQLREKPRLRCELVLPRSHRAFESGRQDLNLRPPGPQPGALPDCATPRDVQSGRRESNPP